METSDFPTVEGEEADKSLLSHTLAYPWLLKPIWFSSGWNSPTCFANFLYPERTLEYKWSTSGNGIC